MASDLSQWLQSPPVAGGLKLKKPSRSLPDRSALRLGCRTASPLRKCTRASALNSCAQLRVPRWPVHPAQWQRPLLLLHQLLQGSWQRNKVVDFANELFLGHDWWWMATTTVDLVALWVWRQAVGSPGPQVDLVK